MSWVQNANCFLSRFAVRPERREVFVAALDELLAFASAWYEGGCRSTLPAARDVAFL